MNARLIPILLLPALALTSCDQAKKLAEQAGSAVKEQLNARSTGGKETADQQLQQLVDQTPEGVVFRKDLPFPTTLEVRTTRRQEWSGRFFQTSAIERRAETIKGTRLTLDKIELTGNKLRHTVEQSGFTIPSADGADEDEAKQTLADPLAAVTHSKQPHVFQKSGTTWIADPEGGFRSAALAKDLSPVLGQLLIENALAPRPLWFSAKKRFKPGDELVVTGQSIPMLLTGNATGTLSLKLESFEPVAGHPCAVFSVSGDYRRREIPDFEGIFTDEEVTIQSGRLWFSLIHPVILKEELETIQSVSSGSRGGQKSRGQGAIKSSVTREWKVPAP
jgi:hypothetical protein